MITSLEEIRACKKYEKWYQIILLVHILVEIIEGGVHDQSAKADGQREEHLGDGRIPHMWVDQLGPLRLHKVNNSLPGSWQSNGPDQQDKHYYIGKQGQEIGGFSRAPNALGQNSADDHPGGQEAQHQIPAGSS